MNVSLNNAGPLLVGLVRLCDYIHDVSVVFCDLNTIATICILTRFKNPDVSENW